MSLPNQEVFILFHPLIYMSKLNIEMTMASLIVRLARTGRADAYQHHPDENHHSTTPRRGMPSASMPAGHHTDLDGHHGHHHHGGGTDGPNDRDVALKTFTESRCRASFSGIRKSDGDERGGGGVAHGGIQRTREFQVTVHHSSSASTDEDVGKESVNDDDAWLTSYPGHPNGTGTAR